MKKTLSPVMRSGSEASRGGHQKVAPTCHAERSEASGATRRWVWPTRMLRCAQH